MDGRAGMGFSPLALSGSWVALRSLWLSGQRRSAGLRAPFLPRWPPVSHSRRAALRPDAARPAREPRGAAALSPQRPLLPSQQRRAERGPEPGLGVWVTGGLLRARPRTCVGVSGCSASRRACSGRWKPEGGFPGPRASTGISISLQRVPDGGSILQAAPWSSWREKTRAFVTTGKC